MTFFFALLGLAVGSLLNVCIDRLPRGESVFFPSSRCEVCGHRLKAKDLVPVLSYLWLRGCCRYCGASLSPRLPLVEALTAAMFVFLLWKYDLSRELVFTLFYGSLFIVFFFTDLEQEIIPNSLVYLAIAVGPVIALLRPGLGIGWAVAGGAAGFALMLLPYLASRGGLGAGDVKLAAVIGLATGFPMVLFALLLSLIGGGIVATFLLLLRVKKRKEAIPLGPFLVTGAMIVLLWGDHLREWYITLL
jgi:leader peptidase (prepilin peptidase)/N-methyltransferase